MDFYNAMDIFALNQANHTGHVACTKSSFEDTNPVPGEDKVCWCDNENMILTADE